MILIFDYGVGNLTSISNMLNKIGEKSIISNRKDDVIEADKIILPGVGSFEYGMNKLKATDSFSTLNDEVLRNKKPVLGICLGAQLLFERSQEGNSPRGLGWIKGEIVKFDTSLFSSGEKVPHMGWGFIKVMKSSRLLDGMDKSRFYFVHSYHMIVSNKEDALLESYYGYSFTSAVERENIVGVQFHPEKSHKFGLQLYSNFVNNF